MQKNASSFAGSIVHEDDVPNTQVSYRWHLPDPARFSNKIKVTLESGHANHLRDDLATTAYWYQTLPGPKLSLSPVEKRLVPPFHDSPGRHQCSRCVPADPKVMVDEWEQRYKEYLTDRQVWVDRRAADSKERSKKNVEIAAEIEARWLAGLKK